MSQATTEANLLDEVGQWAEQVESINTELEGARAKRDRAIRAAAEAGMSARSIAAHARVSPVAVGKVLKGDD